MACTSTDCDFKAVPLARSNLGPNEIEIDTTF